MPTLDENHYSAARPLFQNLRTFHLCGWSVLNGDGPGSVWVDDVADPHVCVVESSEGTYLAGDPDCAGAYAALKEAIPWDAYLICDPPGWERVLGQVWQNPVARRHEREYYLFAAPSAPEWRSRIPQGFCVLPVDQEFFTLARSSTPLENFEHIEHWVGGWHSLEDFFARGAGAAVVHGSTIASWSVMDCALEDRCEIGIVTDSRYRRQGLAKIAVSAVLEMCLARGYRQVGWQCLRSNKGSIATARSVGFHKQRDYLAFSSFLPAESPADLTREEYADWAVHYERFISQITWMAFEAAQAWSLAGEVERALENLRVLKQAGWKARPEWINGNWRLDNLRQNEEALDLLKEIV